jgi:hypothetical protein
MALDLEERPCMSVFRTKFQLLNHRVPHWDEGDEPAFPSLVPREGSVSLCEGSNGCSGGPGVPESGEGGESL